MAKAPQSRKTPVEVWEQMTPPQKVLAYVDAGGRVLAKIVAAGMFLATGAETFHIGPELIDPTRAQDIFAGLAAYYGVPFLWPARAVKGK